MNKIITDIEQSKSLIQKGLDIASADMHYMRYGDQWLPLIGPRCEAYREDVETVPAWTLSALLNVMPSIQLDKLSGLYSLEYADKFTDDYTDPIDAVVEMMEWMLDKGYISKSDEITEGGDK